jgi:hypothetical protein
MQAETAQLNSLFIPPTTIAANQMTAARCARCGLVVAPQRQWCQANLCGTPKVGPITRPVQPARMASIAAAACWCIAGRRCE